MQQRSSARAHTEDVAVHGYQPLHKCNLWETLLVFEEKVTLDKISAVCIIFHFTAIQSTWKLSVNNLHLNHEIFQLTKTKLAQLHCIKVFFDLEQLSNSLSGNSVTRAESSEVIFVILLEVVLPTGGEFPDCLISHINHTLFITITRAALCAAIASALEGNSMRKSVWID